MNVLGMVVALVSTFSTNLQNMKKDWVITAGLIHG